MSVAIATAHLHGATLGQYMLKVAGSLHCLLYQASGGRLGRTLSGAPVLLLTTTGRKTGQSRTRPLCYLEVDDRLVVIASAGGAARHPAWYLNLCGNSHVCVQREGQTRTMVACTAVDAERTWLWAQVIERYPICAAYQRRAGREIPIIVLRELLPLPRSPEIRDQGRIDAV